MCASLRVKYLLFLFDFDETRIFSTCFRKILKFFMVFMHLIALNMGESNVTESDRIYLDFMLIFLSGLFLLRNTSQDISAVKPTTNINA
jgi:uncharacterized protein YhhL (DUF1145 family)